MTKRFEPNGVHIAALRGRAERVKADTGDDWFVVHTADVLALVEAVEALRRIAAGAAALGELNSASVARDALAPFEFGDDA